MTTSTQSVPDDCQGNSPTYFYKSPAVARFLNRWSFGTAPWERKALAALLCFTALLYCWGLDLNGWANSYYSAAAMAGSQDWTAFFYGSSDPANAITVDKPPMSIWVMALSVRLFGLNSWSILLPQALMGVVTVYLLYVLVRRYTSAAVGLLAATFMAVTPVSTVMFRYNNPDALLILIMVAIALAVTTAIDRQRPWLMVVAGALAGAGFLTKQLQIGLILPALAITYLAFAGTTWPKRFLHLAYSAVAAAAVGGSWLLAVQLTAPTDRPFIGGSRTNSALELALGYNGLQRLTGEDALRTTPTAAVDNAFTGGFQRFLEPQFSGQFGWFLPLAVAGLAMGLIWFVKREGSRRNRMLLLFSGTWFLTSATVLAFMSGILHPYYSLTAVPPLCTLAATGLMHLVESQSRKTRLVLLPTLVAMMTLAYVSALRSTSDFPALPLFLLFLWAIAIAFHLLPALPLRLRQASRALLLAVLLAGPIIWSTNTALSPHVGAGVVAGPSISGYRSDHPDRHQLGDDVIPGQVALMFGDTPPPAVLDALRKIPPSTTWVTATIGSETAANYQLELGRAVLPVGGFDGTDPSPTLEQFQALVGQGRVGSLVIQELPPLTLEGKGESARIVQWVRETYATHINNGVELYFLHQP
ncbi:glycosyltransferase family 39 protein [Arthrobacter sp. B1I2]|uniref:glycosyltransferase family 39 protein n=1 Tax=Arthrobacter sp. B1I2 TaxID=3042263 RepID=UPI002781432D|nr:glycosyltransferase family 39 protein [Arthrobacter sp. B1I2]MDQ0731410.1 4-amino-4-deoxy-L-arabinose transferase-like glycosyltransferase [Arthrobacter sp. B1I2]